MSRLLRDLLSESIPIAYSGNKASGRDAATKSSIRVRSAALRKLCRRPVVFTAANVYLGLKIGLTFATSIPAAVISMAVLRAFRDSTIQENNIVQTIASAAGTLSVIVGGPEDTFAAAEDLFHAMGRNVFHVGGHGMGLAMKLINNMLGQIQTVAIAEAMVLGRKAGLDPKKIYEVVSASTGNSVQFQNRVPRILARNFKPGGTLDISFKDQELETAFAKRLGVPLFLANVSQQVYQMGRAAGLSKEDGSSLVKVYEQLAGVKVGGDDRV